MSSSIYGFPLGRQGYDIVDNVTMPYWQPALRHHERRVEHPFQFGYKFHVSAQPHDAERMARAVLPVLQRGNLDHKVVYPVEAYEAMCETEQAGKFITIYAGPMVHACARLIGDLDPILMRLRSEGIVPGPQCMDRSQKHSVAETASGKSGMLWRVVSTSYFK